MNQFVFSLAILSTLVTSGLSIECYECIPCEDDDSLEPKECGETDRCVKVDMFVALGGEEATSTMRLCAPKIIESCSQIHNAFRNLDHDKKEIFMHSKLECNFCEEDLCNASRSLYSLTFTYYIIPFVAIFML